MILFQIILDKKFKNVDNEIKEFISSLEKNKKRFFDKLGKKRFYPIYYNKNINTSELVKKEINSLLK